MTGLSKHGPRVPSSGEYSHQRAQVPAEIITGSTLAALSIPEVLGYNKISGAHLITSLYKIPLPITQYALFGASRHLVVGADFAT